MKIRKVSERNSYILDTLLTENTQQSFTHASGIFRRICSMQVSEHICMMMMMWGSSMHEAKHDLEVILYPA